MERKKGDHCTKVYIIAWLFFHQVSAFWPIYLLLFFSWKTSWHFFRIQHPHYSLQPICKFMNEGRENFEGWFLCVAQPYWKFACFRKGFVHLWHLCRMALADVEWPWLLSFFSHRLSSCRQNRSVVQLWEALWHFCWNVFWRHAHLRPIKYKGSADLNIFLREVASLRHWIRLPVILVFALGGIKAFMPSETKPLCESSHN